jgi:hypothetical protein
MPCYPAKIDALVDVRDAGIDDSGGGEDSHVEERGRPERLTEDAASFTPGRAII